MSLRQSVVGISEVAQPDNILHVENLRVFYDVKSSGSLWRGSQQVRAVDDVSFFIRSGETLGLVGESGCGKSSVARAVVRLLQPNTGKIWFDGTDISRLKPGDLRPFRKNLQMVFQDPGSSLNPRKRMSQLLAEPMQLARWPQPQIRSRVDELLTIVGFDRSYLHRFPHQLSGGQRQRIAIARALALSPKLIVCDEPVSSLDVSIQAQIVNLLKDIQGQSGVSYLFVAHDLGVVRQMSDRVAMMYLGKIVEEGSRADIYRQPHHPYTQALLSAVLKPDPEAKRERIVLAGDLPSPISPPKGCRFHTRCPLAISTCSEIEPVLREIDGRLVACHLAPNAIINISQRYGAPDRENVHDLQDP